MQVKYSEIKGTVVLRKIVLQFLFDVDFSLFRPLEFFVDPKNGDGRNNNPPAMWCATRQEDNEK